MNKLTVICTALVALTMSAANARTLECYVPSSSFVEGVERVVVKLDGQEISVFETKPERSYQQATKGFRTVLFHQYSDPKVSVGTNLYNAEPAHSLIALQSNYKGTEFAADIIVVNWGKGTLKSVSSYQDVFNSRWLCTRPD
jgi:hypothetical protein